jgi:hypothetical protein
VLGASSVAPTGGAVSAAVRRVADEGYRVVNTSTYDPSAAIRVLVGVHAASADGANQRAFFFAGDRYLGTDTLDPSAHVTVVRQANNVVTLRYDLYRPADPMCCPRAGTADCGSVGTAQS